ncbi:hypothetical protein, partial [Brotaphodocola sp.]|uniref:hypothetical protein n=1 Tax=Brotaphodocola sp. TaxID=3073577 RepID=UPI003D7C7E91
REGAKRQWRLLCTDRSGTEKRSDFDKKMSAELTKITRQVSASVDLKNYIWEFETQGGQNDEFKGKKFSDTEGFYT